MTLSSALSFVTPRALRHMSTAAFVLVASLSHAQMAPSALAKPEALQTSPDSAGALVYRGDTFTQRTPAGDPLYRYERRRYLRKAWWT